MDKFAFVFSDVAQGGCDETEEAAVMSPTIIVTIKYGTDYIITSLQTDSMRRLWVVVVVSLLLLVEFNRV